MKTLKTKLLIAFVAVFSFAFANNTFLTDLPAQIKAFLTENKVFINKIKTISVCKNLSNLFTTLEKDANANKGLTTDDISTRFNQAFKNDNPSGEALKHYETAYGLFTKAFKTNKVDFVNPNPEVEEEEEDPMADLLNELDKENEELNKELEEIRKEGKELDKELQKEKQKNEALNYYISLVEKKDKSIAECIKLTKAKYPTVDIEAILKKASKSN